MAETAVAESLRTEIEEILDKLGLEIIEISLGSTQLGWTLRILVDRPEGVDLSVCESASMALSKTICSSNELKDDTVLEISSAGVNRVLVKDSDYDRFENREAKLKVRGEAGNVTYRGVLKGRDGKFVLLMDKGELRRIPIDDIWEGRLDYRFRGKSR